MVDEINKGVDLNRLLAPYIESNNSNVNKDKAHYYPFSLISRIGQVYDFKNEYRYKNEFLAGEKIGDFVMPKNSNKSIFDLARIYGFYESSNGINVKGKEFTIKNINYGNANSFMIEEPVLVGDILILNNEKRVMIDTVNVYNGSINLPWTVTYQYVLENDFNYPLAKPKDETEQPQYYQKLYDTKAVIRDEVIKFVDIFEKSLNNCSTTTPAGVYLLSPPLGFDDMMEQFKVNFIKNIDDALKVEKDASY